MRVQGRRRGFGSESESCGAVLTADTGCLPSKAPQEAEGTQPLHCRLLPRNPNADWKRARPHTHRSVTHNSQEQRHLGASSGGRTQWPGRTGPRTRHEEAWDLPLARPGSTQRGLCRVKRVTQRKTNARGSHSPVGSKGPNKHNKQTWVTENILTVGGGGRLKRGRGLKGRNWQ